MIPDANLLLSDAQAVTASAASTSIVDQLAAGDAYKAPWVEFLVNTTFTSNGATIQLQIQTDSDSAFGTAVNLFETGALAVADLVAGYRVRVRIPQGAKRYLRAYYTVASGPAAGGKIDCRVLSDIDIPLGA